MNTDARTVSWLSRAIALPIAIMAVAIVGCATSPAKYRPTTYPSTVRDWYGIDSAEFLQGFRLEDYSVLVVEPLVKEGLKMPPQNDNTYAPTVDILNRMDSILLPEIQRELRGKLPVTATQPDEAGMAKALVLRGKVTEIDPGSQAARYWGGFGAGQAWVTLQGEILDGKSGQPLIKFQQKRVDAAGAFGGSYNSVLTDCVVMIGRDIGRMLTVFATPAAK